MPVSSARTRSTRARSGASRVRDEKLNDDGTTGRWGAEETTETFGFTPIGAMRSLENVELSAERNKGSVREAETPKSGKRVRRTSTPGKRRASAPRVEAADDERENDATATMKEDLNDINVVESERRASKTFWAPTPSMPRAAPAPLARTNGLPPTPAVYNAVPWPSSIPIVEQSPVRTTANGAMKADAMAYATPGGQVREALEPREAHAFARAPALALAPLAHGPKELAAQLVEVKREIAKRQSEAIEVSRVLRQLQCEEADLFSRAAEIQRQLLQCTTEEQPYDLSVTIGSNSVERMIALEERPDTTPRSVQRSAQRGVDVPVEQAQPSTSKIVAKDMRPFQKLDVRKAMISVDFIDGPGGLSLFTASADNCLRLWAPDSRKPAALIRAPRGMSSTTVMNERVVCVGTELGQVVQIDIATGMLIGSLTHGEHAAPWSVKTLAKFGQEESALVAAAGMGGDIKIWDARIARGGGAPMVMYSHGAAEIRGMSFSPDGHTLVAAASNDLRAFDLRMNGRSTRLSVAESLHTSWNSVFHDASTSEILALSSSGDVHAWSASAPYAHARTVRAVCAPNSSAALVLEGTLFCPVHDDACGVDVVRHATSEVIARWRPSDADDGAAVACVARASAGDVLHPYGRGALAIGTVTGTVCVFAPDSIPNA
ncbi:WD40-repeat-containing domain protein [Ostreococcus tauri]|uniref:WD40-repeat-containing domain protein n=1 Tax=Ostreococcus tauri TaxID=70448 RepID=A0A1Y5I9C1_OSTTA|nr:WD40-repeat-containing domain protein [Ostreococcus tauri]